MTQLSEHFALEEMTNSQTAARKGIDNTPPADVLERLRETAQRMEQVRRLVGVVTVSSGYRSPALNAAIGGAPSSAHVLGYAVDFNAFHFGSPLEVCRQLVAQGVRFDQLIEEGTWVHISFDPRMRGEVLTKGPGGTYRKGLRS